MPAPAPGPPLSRAELLILVGLAGAAVAGAAPAVAKVRAAADKARCADNLRVTAHAVLGFEAAYGFFPSSVQDTGPQRSWAVQVLPWLGAEAVAREFDYTRPWCDPANAAAVARQVPWFACPAAPGGPRTATGVVYLKYLTGERTKYDVAGAAATDYAAVDEVKQDAFVYQQADVRGYGVLKEDQFPRRADVADGLGNTLLVVECAGRPTRWVLGRPAPAAPADAGKHVSGAPWASRSNDFGLDGFDPRRPDADAGPCAINCTNDNEAYSFHPGGATAALADGSVRFVRDTITTRLFARLVTRSGGEPIDWADY